MLGHVFRNLTVHLVPVGEGAQRVDAAVVGENLQRLRVSRQPSGVLGLLDTQNVFEGDSNVLRRVRLVPENEQVNDVTQLKFICCVCVCSCEGA